VQANDVDPDDTPTCELVDGPSHDEDFDLYANGRFTYEPEADFNGLDTFTYRLVDPFLKESATVTVQCERQPGERRATLGSVSAMAGGVEDTPFTITTQR